MEEYTLDALNFAEILKEIDLGWEIHFGKFMLKYTKGVKSKINYNQEENSDLLEGKQQYTFELLSGSLEVSLQLYKNISNHYRLFCFTRFNGKHEGMTFSLNLTTEKESDNIIYLTQKLKFSEQYPWDKLLAQAHRRQKQSVLSELLIKLGLDVTDTNDLILGIYDPQKKKFVNTNAQQFLNDFIVVSLLKGHFQGNKWYQLEILPSYNKYKWNDDFTGRDEKIPSLPKKIINNKSKRSIPLWLRYKVLRNDNFTCVACGRKSEDGVKLHIDHKIPYSLWWLTELNNLQTLCEHCNIGKSNKYIDK